MKVWWHSMQVRQIQLSSLDQNRQETGVSWHANPWLIRSTRTAGVSKHPSHLIRQVNPFHLHVFKLFFLFFFFFLKTASPICFMWLRWQTGTGAVWVADYQSICGRQTELRVENRLGYLKSQGWTGQSCGSRCVDVNYWEFTAEMRCSSLRGINVRSVFYL